MIYNYPTLVLAFFVGLFASYFLDALYKVCKETLEKVKGVPTNEKFEEWNKRMEGQLYSAQEELTTTVKKLITARVNNAEDHLHRVVGKMETRLSSLEIALKRMPNGKPKAEVSGQPTINGAAQ